MSSINNKTLILIISAAIIILAGFGFPGEVSATYYATGTLVSTNLLLDEVGTVSSIDSFWHNASSIPPGTYLKTQFSQDNSTWKNSTGTINGWDTQSEGSHSIDLSGLGWSGANFYYKTQFESTQFNTKGLWHFDEGSGTSAADSSGNGNDGTLLPVDSEPTWKSGSDCKYGSCLSFDGTNDYVDCGSGASLDSLQQFTLEAWVRASDWHHVSTILDKGPESTVQHFWLGWWGDGYQKMNLEMGDASGRYYLWGEAGLTWETNRWYHVAVTLDNVAKTYQHYRDGVSAGGGTFTQDFNSGTYQLLIGRYSAVGHYFNGIIDEVRILNTALTAEQIAADYAATKGFFEDGGTPVLDDITLNYNVAPSNGAGSIADMDDADNIYAQRKLYTGSSVCSDTDGYADIDYCEFRLKQGDTTRAIFRYDEDTDTFSVESGEWDLDSSSSAAESGNDITISWKFTPQWDAVAEDDLEIELYVVDAGSAEDTDIVQSDYVDVVTDLVTTFSLNDDRGNVSQSITASGAVTYTNSSLYPPDAEFTSVSVFDSACDLPENTEGTDSSIVNGDWSITFNAPATVGTDTYNLYINMADADYSDGEEASPTDTFITDQVVFKTGTTLDVTDSRVNADGSATGEWYAELMLDYDDSEIESGTINLNSGTMSWDAGQGRWESTTASATVQSISRNIASVSGLSYGVTSIDSAVTSDSEAIIFDKVQVQSYTVADSRVNIDDSVNVDALLYYDYDDSAVTDGTVTVNAVSASHQGGGTWRITQSQSSVQGVTYDTVVASGNTYGISAVAQNGKSTTVVWDRMEVISVAFDDNRVDISGSAEVRYSLQYDYDDVAFDDTKGSITDFTWDSGNSWWDKAITASSSVGSTNYDETDISLTDSTYGITAIEDDSGADIIADRINILTLSAVDDAISVNTEGTWYATAELEYDSYSLSSGDSFTLSSYAFSWDVADNRFEATDTKSSPQAVTINAFDSGSETTYGITAGSINGLSQSIEWQATGGGGGLPAVAFSPPTPPRENFSILINNGEELTNKKEVILKLNGGPDAVRMAISNFSDFRNAGQETYQTTKSWDICQGRESCPESEYTVYAKFYTSWGQPSDSVSDTIIYKKEKPIVEKIIEEIKKIPEILEPLIPEILKPKPPEEVKPPEVPIEELVPKEAPAAFKSQWTLLTYTLQNKPFVKFTLAPLPKEFQKLAEKFPELEKTFTEVGIQQLIDIEKLRPVKLTLPGLTERVGLPTAKIEPGKFALPQGIPVAELSPEIKEQIPTEIVFAKTGGELIDFNIALSITEKGEAEQKITTISGSPLDLTVKPEKPVNSIKGYIIFKAKKTEPSSFELPLNSFVASLLFANPIFAEEHNPEEIEEVLVLMEFEYADPDGDGIYTANIQAPLVEGEYEIITVMDYQDPDLGQKEIRLITVVDPEGYVYEKAGDKETRIPGAIISLFWLNPETKQYELWPAKEYHQENPQITDTTGKYAFLVPNDSYYLKVEAPGYLTYDGRAFQVGESSGIHINIELKTKYWWLKVVDWKIIVMIFFGILLLYNFYRDKVRERKSRNI